MDNAWTFAVVNSEETLFADLDNGKRVFVHEWVHARAPQSKQNDLLYWVERAQNEDPEEYPDVWVK